MSLGITGCGCVAKRNRGSSGSGLAASKEKKLVDLIGLCLKFGGGGVGGGGGGGSSGIRIARLAGFQTSSGLTV